MVPTSDYLQLDLSSMFMFSTSCNFTFIPNGKSMIQRMVKIHMNGVKLLDTILLGETDNVRMEVAVVSTLYGRNASYLKPTLFCHTKLIILFHSQRLSLSVMYRLPILDIPFYDTLDKHLTLYSWEMKAYTLWVFNL